MDGGRYPKHPDPTGLRPATVEELAAQERARPPRFGRPAVIAVATCAVLLAGAGAFSLATTDPEPKLVEPAGAAAPFGVDYVDGFGEHSPKPRPVASKARRKSEQPPPAPRITVSVLASLALPTESAPQPTSQKPAPSSEPVRASAVYWTNTWHDDKYITYVWVSNDSEQPLDWQVDVRLPEGATVDGSMAARRTARGGIWTFTSTDGLLRGWHVYLFAFSGRRGEGRFSMLSCEVNGIECRLFG